MPEHSSAGENGNQELQSGGQNSPVESPSTEVKDGSSSETLLDRFNAVMSAQGAGESSDPKGSEDGVANSDAGPQDSDPEGAKKPGDTDGELGDVTDEELRGYKPATAKRVKQLMRERNEARDKLREATKQFEEQLRGDVRIQSFERISQFVQDAGLSKDEVNQGFEIMRLMKHEPAKALEALRPYVEQLLTVTGNVLPQDLQEKVVKGEITEAMAQELSRARAEMSFMQQSNERRQQMTVVQQQQQLANAAGQAVSQWETSWSQSDPDYKRKQPYVMREIERRLLKGEVPTNPDAALKMCNDIKKQIEDELAAFRPQKPEVKAVTGGTQPSNLPAAKSTLEAMQRALNRKAG